MGLLSRIKKKTTVDLDPLLEMVQRIKTTGNYIVLVPGTTGYSWMGVNRASKATFPKHCLELPQYYSNSLLEKDQIKIIINEIKRLEFDQIILSGFPPYFEDIVKLCNGRGLRVKILYHGFFSELSGNELQEKVLSTVLRLAKKKAIECIGFNKKGMAESLSSLWDIPTEKIMLKTPRFDVKPEKYNDGKIHIGVLANDQFRKNLHNQIVAAAMIENAVLHITTEQTFDYLPANIEIQRHPTGMEHDEFLAILGSMDVNLHLSYSESWGQLTTESLALGVPCLTAYHSDIFDHDNELKVALIVKDYDNAFAISKRIRRVLENDELPQKCVQYIERLNEIAEHTFKSFLDQ